jgi:hypothetical protein
MASIALNTSGKFSFSYFEKLLLVILVVFSLIPVWSNKYFITGDGPCHLYNSKVLLDFITSHNLDFYDDYYVLNKNLDPNWFSHITLALLLSFLPDFLAEKIFVSAYIILFAVGLRWLLKTINKENAFLVLLGFSFVFHHTFQMGFFNYSFSFVFFFFSVGYWLSQNSNFTIPKILILSIINTVLFFVHPVGWILSALTIGLIILFEFIIAVPDLKKQAENPVKKFINKLYIFCLVFLPSILLSLGYILRKGLKTVPNPDSLKHLYHSFLELTALVNMTNKEHMWAICLSVLFGLIFLYGLFYKLRTRRFNKSDAFFIVFIIMLYIYFRQPGQIAGAGIVSVRLQFIPFLCVLLWFAGITFNLKIKWAAMLSAFSISIILIAVRIPHHAMASRVVKEYVSVRDYIEDKSTVLPLSYSHNGKTPGGELIANRIWLFMHASDYIGTDKSLVIFDNFEGNTGYFPIIWKREKNPYYHISTNEGFENQPPSVDILNYNKKTGGDIDYVITWCLDEQYLNHSYTVNTIEQLKRNYTLVFSSENNLAKLYKKIEK